MLLQEVSGKVNNTSPTVWLLCAVRTVQLSLAYKNILGSWLPLYLREFGTTNTAARNVGESLDSQLLFRFRNPMVVGYECAKSLRARGIHDVRNAAIVLQVILMSTIVAT